MHVGMIGLGGMGTVHLQAFMKQTDEEKDIQVVALSEIYTRRKQRARDIAKLTDKDVHHDYRPHAEISALFGHCATKYTFQSSRLAQFPIPFGQKYSCGATVVSE
jgi:hypothetical protein